jgi:hypothetical protein
LRIGMTVATQTIDEELNCHLFHQIVSKVDLPPCDDIHLPYISNSCT